MWIASKHGFYSIKKNGDGDYYVRRKKNHSSYHEMTRNWLDMFVHSQ